MKAILGAMAVGGLLFVGGGSANAQSLQGPENADEDGCFTAGDRCVSVKSEFRGKGEYREFRIQMTNNCRARLYIKYCFERTDGKASCRATGLRPGRSTLPGVTSTYNGTGRYSVNWVGVLQPSKDWVCAGKVEGWNDPTTFD